MACAALAAPTAPPEPRTSRDFFNLGSEQLKLGKLREAEAHLEAVLYQQEDRWQAPALYNLGQVRFAQGQEELKKGPNGKEAAARGRMAIEMTRGAIEHSDRALSDGSVQNMVAAYVRGRGVRRELKSATQAVKKALQTHGAALQRWQRSSADFRGTLESQPGNEDARYNSAVVDAHIARLIDSMREMQQAASAMKQKGDELKEKMEQLKGRIPKPDMPPGAPGDEEEEEEQPKGPPPGAEEGPSKEGEEMELSPEQAGWMLESFRLDTDRRLPMGQQPSPPRDRNRPTW